VAELVRSASTDKLTIRETDMNDCTNGLEAPPPPINPLAEAIQLHAAALLKANTNRNGMMAINPAQLYCDLELAQVRIEVLFEALVSMGAVDPQDLTLRLRAKLLAEVEQLNAPQLEIASGSILRNG
jgi:hypothetical protein